MKKNSEQKGLILCAGLGTRLRPLTQAYAKPALPVLGVPSLWFSAWHLKKELGLSQLAVNVGHAPQTVSQALADAQISQHLNTNFFVSDESSQILGSSGVLWKLKDWIGNSRLFATNGDSIFYPDWQKMLAFHIKSNAAMTLHVRKFTESDGQFTDLQFDAEKRLKKLGPKSKTGIMFSGAYILEPSVIQTIPAGVSDLKTTVFDPLIAQEKLFVFEENIPWFDTGSVETYAKTQFDLLKAEPRFQSLVELKMKEVSKQAWVPKDWNEKNLALHAPVILQGMAKEWLSSAKSFGPNFIGIEAPKNKKEISTKNAIVMGDLEIHL